MSRHLIRSVSLLLSLLLAGCDQALRVPTTFPEPVVEPLPLDIALHFTDEFAN